MRTFVVNLEKDKVRRDSIKSQLNNINIPFEFVKAVYGKNLSQSELSECYNDSKAMRTQCRSLTLSEIGCAYSHIKIYQKMIRENIQTALILEDDAIIPRNSSEILLNIENIIEHEIPEVILLSPVELLDDKSPETKIDNIYNLKKFKKGYLTSSYIINLYAAKTLLEELYPIGDVADCWKRLSNHKIVDIRVVDPPLIQQNREDFESSIVPDVMKNQKTSTVYKIGFKFRRAFWLSCDMVLAFYNRKTRPYGGLKN